MSEHRCKDGTWQPGKTKDCDKCKPAAPPPFSIKVKW